jgi:hypothetical protein
MEEQVVGVLRMADEPIAKLKADHLANQTLASSRLGIVVSLVKCGSSGKQSIGRDWGSRLCCQP